MTSNSSPIYRNSQRIWSRAGIEDDGKNLILTVALLADEKTLQFDRVFSTQPIKIDANLPSGNLFGLFDASNFQQVIVERYTFDRTVLHVELKADNLPVPCIWAYDPHSQILGRHIPANLQFVNNSINNVWDELSGRTFVTRLIQWLDDQRIHAPESIIDFGGGYGRLSMRFAEQMLNTHVDMHDINADGVSYILECNIPRLNATLHKNMGPILTNKPCDMLIANSIFTHFTLEQEDHYIQQIHNCLRPGGIAVITLLEDLSLAILPMSQSEEDEFFRNGRIEKFFKGEDLVNYKKYGYSAKFLSYCHKEYFENKVKEYGFTVIDSKPCFADILTAIFLRKD